MAAALSDTDAELPVGMIGLIMNLGYLAAGVMIYRDNGLSQQNLIILFISPYRLPLTNVICVVSLKYTYSNHKEDKIKNDCDDTKR